MTATAEAPMFESVRCYLCGGSNSRFFISAEDDLTGKPGRFHFVTCNGCGLAYQNPRITLERIGAFYDDQYIAHRKTRPWGPLAPLFDRAMNKLDADKARLIARYVMLDRTSRVLDVGCATGTFLQRLRTVHGAHVSGVDFKDLSSSPSLEGIEFHCGLFYEVPLAERAFDLVTMWHFLEHDYDPVRSLRTAYRVMKPGGRLVIEVPRLDSRTFRWFGDRWPGLQAPQHTVLLDRASLVRLVTQAGFEVVDYLPYVAFPSYFYLFTGVAFRLLEGRGLNLDRAIVPYFLGQALAAPLLLFERRLNLAMQTIVCAPAARARRERSQSPSESAREWDSARPDRSGQSRASVLQKLRVLSLASVAGAIVTAAALVLIPIGVLTLFRARRLYSAIARQTSRAVLRLYGVRLRLHQERPFPNTQTIYISNHSSTLDLVILVALGLPNCRFFLSGFLLRLVPLGIISWMMGTFFTAPQSRSAERTRIFQRAERILRKTGESVYLSPEGGRITT